jgi:hypothetical protein
VHCVAQGFATTDVVEPLSGASDLINVTGVAAGPYIARRVSPRRDDEDRRQAAVRSRRGLLRRHLQNLVKHKKWSSSIPAALSIDQHGEATAKAAGTFIITVQDPASGKTGTVEVTVAS